MADKRAAELFLSLSGLDATTASTIHARQYDSLHEVIPVEATPDAGAAARG